MGLRRIRKKTREHDDKRNSADLSCRWSIAGRPRRACSICRRCRRPCGQRWGWTAANVLYMLATNGVQDTDLGDNF
jgi:hypothetical protein